MLPPLILKASDITSYISTEKVLYASGERKRFYITLNGRFVVVNMVTNYEKVFTDLNKAIDYFNDLNVLC